MLIKQGSAKKKIYILSLLNVRYLNYIPDLRIHAHDIRTNWTTKIVTDKKKSACCFFHLQNLTQLFSL